MSWNVISSSEFEIPFSKVYSRLGSCAWIVLISLAIVAPALIWGIPTNRNLFNHFRFALPFYDALRSGHWYPSWLGESNAGYGDPSFRFYPPGVYYLLALCRATTGSWYAGTLTAFGLIFGIGGLGTYYWAREFVDSRIAIWAGIIYTLAPYHLVQIYQGFLLAEFAGAAVLPFVFFFAERVCTNRRLKNVAGLAASYAILIFTHLPLTVIGSLALLVYSSLRLERTKRISTIASLAGAVALGLAASATYWTMMVAELPWIHGGSVNAEYAAYYGDNFILSTFSPENLNVWWMNILLLATMALFWPALVLLRKGALHAIVQPKIKVVCLLLFFTIFMATPASRPLWDLIKPLQETQFPWRWLALTSMSGSVLVAAAIPFWKHIWLSRKRALVLIVLGSIAASLAFSFSHIIREAGFLDRDEFASVLERIHGSQSISYWWPVWMNGPLREMQAPVEAGSRVVTVNSWEPERKVIRVGEGATTVARLRSLYYPHWKATANGQSLPLYADKDGAMLVELPTNESLVVLDFVEPRRAWWAALVTLAGWLSITALTIWEVVRLQSKTTSVEFRTATVGTP